LSIHPDKTNKDSPLWCSIGTVKNISREGKVDAVSNRVREYKNIGKCEQEYKLNWSFAMTYPAARSLIIRIAKKAGITKPINPHNFRHSRATLLGAAGLNQSLMNEIMGWAQGSKMSGVYIHMSGKQTDDALLPALYGMKVEENKDKQPKMFPIKCPKCQKVNDYNAERCIECNHLLIESHEVVIREKQKENEFEEMKKNMKLLQQRFDSLYGTVALNEMENGNDFGSISDEGMLPPIEMKITKVQQAKVNKNWIRTIKK
jgi:phage FluMu protein Com